MNTSGQHKVFQYTILVSSLHYTRISVNKDPLTENPRGVRSEFPTFIYGQHGRGRTLCFQQIIIEKCATPSRDDLLIVGLQIAKEVLQSEQCLETDTQVRTDPKENTASVSR